MRHSRFTTIIEVNMPATLFYVAIRLEPDPAKPDISAAYEVLGDYVTYDSACDAQERYNDMIRSLGTS